MSFLWSIIIGITAGFLAGVLMKGRGFGCLTNLIIGAVGAVLGGWIFSSFNISIEEESIIGNLTMSTVGAIILLLIFSLFKRKDKS